MCFSLRQIAALTFCGLFAAASLCLAQTGTFQQVPGSLSQISVGADGAVWGVDASGKLYQLDTNAQSLIPIGQGVTDVVVANDNYVFAYNKNTGATYWYV